MEDKGEKVKAANKLFTAGILNPNVLLSCEPAASVGILGLELSQFMGAP